ncbi:MAG: hypothetical protein CBHOC_1863 [uncultured Caballeronia sp.]|nr:MAG: hypothetical protein CBHOC_1863 [uncultured Caballeronia sp.]
MLPRLTAWGQRRPDLASLPLSQKNMDQKLSTLTLANEVLAEHISRQQDITPQALLKTLATHRQTAQTPYHQSYETIRQALLEQQPDLSVLSRSPDVTGEGDIGSLLAILANISPVLKEILTEEITAQNAAELYEKNFSQDINLFKSRESIADYYGLSHEQLAEFIGGELDCFMGNEDNTTGPIYVDGKYTSHIANSENSFETVRVTLVRNLNINTNNYIELVPIKDNKHQVRFSFKQALPENSRFSILSLVGSAPVFEEDFVPLAGEHYTRIVTFENINSSYFTVALSRQEPQHTGSSPWVR